MARRVKRQLDGSLELWARWHFEGCQASAGRSMLAKLIDNKGEIFFGASGGASEPADSIESAIESRVMAMFASDPIRADVLRMEYDAGWWSVAVRRQIRGYDPRGVGQFEKADALGVSLATYKRRLTEARTAIAEQLGLL